MHQRVGLATSSFLGSGGSEGRPWPSWAGAQEPGGKYLKCWRLARLAARQIVISTRCSMDSQAPRKLVEVLNSVSAAGGPSATLPACFARRAERVKTSFQLRRHSARREHRGRECTCTDRPVGRRSHDGFQILTPRHSLQRTMDGLPLRFKDSAFRRDLNVRLHGSRLQKPERVSSPDRTGPSSPNSSLATPIPGC
jgi:hypothetical protein